MRILPLMLCLASAAAQPASLEALVAAERSFDAASAERGIRAAFLQFLAADAVLLQPQPVPGRALWQGRAETPDSLRWYPSLADIAAAGDLGYTSGPYVYTPDGGEPSHGHFVSIWREDADGELRVALDGGIPHPPGAAAALFDPATARARPAAAPEPTANGLLIADQACSDAIVSAGYAVTLRRWASSDARIYRSGERPFSAHPAATDGAWEAPAFATFDRGGGEASRSQDLGYTYGLARRAGAEQWTDAWLRIWRREGDQWRIALDLMLELPASG